MAAKRKFKVRVRGKVRNQLLRRGGVAAGLTAGLLAAAWLAGYAVKNSKAFIESRLQFRPEAVDVVCASAEALGSIRELASAAVKKPLSSGRAAELAAEIRRRHPGLASVSVSRNFLTRKASIEAEPEKVVAQVLSDGATAYLGVTGRLMGENLSGAGEAPFAVELRGAPGAAPELAAFLAELKPLAGLFYAEPARLACDGAGRDCSLWLRDGSVALWGRFEFTRLKILRLNEVMKDALAKSGGPLRADLRSFGEGKIFVSALKQAAPSKRTKAAGAYR
jgi:hypothetical protein